MILVHSYLKRIIISSELKHFPPSTFDYNCQFEIGIVPARNISLLRACLAKLRNLFD